MKPKKVAKKLVLSKETVANVLGENMNKVLGGCSATTTYIGSICDTEDCTKLIIQCRSEICPTCGC